MSFGASRVLRRTSMGSPVDDEFRSQVARRLRSIESEGAVAMSYIGKIRMALRNPHQIAPQILSEVELFVPEIEAGVQRVMGGANEIGPLVADQAGYGELTSALVAIRSLTQRAALLSDRVDASVREFVTNEKRLAELQKRSADLARRAAELEESELRSQEEAAYYLAQQAERERRMRESAAAAALDEERAALAAAVSRLRAAERSASMIVRARSL